jgi:hypothetical protein
MTMRATVEPCAPPVMSSMQALSVMRKSAGAVSMRRKKRPWLLATGREVAWATIVPRQTLVVDAGSGTLASRVSIPQALGSLHDGVAPSVNAD